MGGRERARRVGARTRAVAAVPSWRHRKCPWHAVAARAGLVACAAVSFVAGTRWRVGASRPTLLTARHPAPGIRACGSLPLWYAGTRLSLIEQAWHKMEWHAHYVGRGGILSFAMSAVDIALWDIRCKRARQVRTAACGTHSAHAPCLCCACTAPNGALNTNRDAFARSPYGACWVATTALCSATQAGLTWTFRWRSFCLTSKARCLPSFCRRSAAVMSPTLRRWQRCCVHACGNGGGDSNYCGNG